MSNFLCLCMSVSAELFALELGEHLSVMKQFGSKTLTLNMTQATAKMSWDLPQWGRSRSMVDVKWRGGEGENRCWNFKQHFSNCNWSDFWQIMLDIDIFGIENPRRCLKGHSCIDLITPCLWVRLCQEWQRFQLFSKLNQPLFYLSVKRLSNNVISKYSVGKSRVKNI